MSQATGPARERKGERHLLPRPKHRAADAPAPRPSAPEHVGGTLVIRNKVVEKIAGVALREVEGAASAGPRWRHWTGNTDTSGRPGDGVHATVGQSQAAFDIRLVVAYGEDVPGVVADVRRRISARVHEMTGLEVIEIKVEIVDIDMPGDGMPASSSDAS